MSCLFVTEKVFPASTKTTNLGNLAATPNGARSSKHPLIRPKRIGLGASQAGFLGVFDLSLVGANKQKGAKGCPVAESSNLQTIPIQIQAVIQ